MVSTKTLFLKHYYRRQGQPRPRPRLNSQPQGATKATAQNTQSESALNVSLSHKSGFQKLPCLQYKKRSTRTCPKLVHIFAWKLVSRASKQVSRNLGPLWQPGVYNDTNARVARKMFVCFVFMCFSPQIQAAPNLLQTSHLR